MKDIVRLIYTMNPISGEGYFAITKEGEKVRKNAEEVLPELRDKMIMYQELFEYERKLKNKRVKLLKEIREEFNENKEEWLPEYFI